MLPRVEPVLAAAPGGEGDVAAPAGARRSRPRSTSTASARTARARRPRGSPGRSTRGAASFTTGVLRADSDARPLVVLDLRGTRVESDLDAAVRAAASLTVHLGARGGCALLVPGERRPLLVDEGAARLAARARAAGARRGRRAARRSRAVGARRGLLIWVAARALAQPPRGLARAAGVARVLVVPGTLAGRRASFTVAGCSGYALGSRARPARGPLASEAA